MMTHPVARYLVRFGPGNMIEAPRNPVIPDVLASDFAEPEDPTPLIESARAEGEAAGFAAAQVVHEAALIQERETFAAELAEHRRVWCDDQSEVLTERIVAAGQALEANIAACVERVLRPFLNETLRKRAIDDLADKVRILVTSGEDAALEITGPEDLLVRLSARLPDSRGTIVYTSNDAADIRIVAAQTVIESCAAAWIERLQAEVE